MSRSKAFTLLESVIVLAVVAFSACFVLTLPKKTDKKIQTSFLKQYESFFSQAQLSAQRDSRDVDFVFQGQTISFVSQSGRMRSMPVPPEFHTDSRHMSLKANGYVAPTRVIFLNRQNKPCFSLIYSLGFGNYRVAQND